MAPPQVHRRWFDDGDMILVAFGKQNDGTEFLFRVHSHLLSIFSPIFRGMLSLPQPEDAETLHGCHVVRLPDVGEDLEAFLNALYDGVTLNRKDSSYDETCRVLCVLRMSFKYDVTHLKDGCILLLRDQWPSEFEKYCLVQHGLSEPRHDEAIEIIRVCRELSIPDLLPTAFLELSASSLYQWSSDNTRLDSFHISDVRRCLVGKERIYTKVHNFMRTHYEVDGCSHWDGGCYHEVQKSLLLDWPNNKYLFWRMEKMDHEALLQAYYQICHHSSEAFLKQVERNRREIWKGIRLDFDIVEMEKNDL